MDARSLLPDPFFLIPRGDDPVGQFERLFLPERVFQRFRDVRPVVRVDEGKQAHAVRPHEMLRRVPGKAGDPLADKADLPIRRVLALIGEAGKVVHQGFELAAFLVQLHPDEHVVAFELLPEALVGDMGADTGQHFIGMERFVT